MVSVCPEPILPPILENHRSVEVCPKCGKKTLVVNYTTIGMEHSEGQENCSNCHYHSWL